MSATPIGRSYNTLIKAEKGDLLKVVFVDASRYTDPKTGKVWFRLWAPRVIQKLNEGETTSIEEMEKTVRETTGRMEDKPFPKEFAEPLPEGVKMLSIDYKKGGKNISYEEESELIKENKKLPGADRKHKFVAAEWTHKNGHPRCIICGDDESCSGFCNDPNPEQCGGELMRMENLKGMYIVDPHARWIYEGKKKLIVKSEKFDVAGEQFYLVDNNFAYGKISIKNIFAMSEKMFDEMRKEHLVSDEERKKWWNGKQLYGYEFSFEKFEKPRRVDIPQGVQTFVNNVKFLLQEFPNIVVDPSGPVESWMDADAYVLTRPNETMMKGTAKPVFATSEVFDAMKDAPFEDINLIEEGKVFDVKGEMFVFSDGKVHNVKELAKRYRYVLHLHARGKSIHGDMRFEKDDHLEGFTLAVQTEKEIKKPVESLEDLKALMADSSNWKMDFASLGTREREGGVEKISATPKAKQPKVWLDMNGVTEKTEPGDPVPVGATRFHPGVFLIVRKGLYEPGADKPDFKEFFTQDGRIVFRYIPGLKGLKWEYWKPEDQTPYVLSDRAVSIGWMPPVGQSALPSNWEKKIPQEFRYWEHGNGAQKTRDALIAFLKGKKELSQEKFVFSRRSWKGATVIRDMPVTSFYLKFGKYKFSLGAGNPLFESAVNAEQIQENKFFEPGSYHPGTVVNPENRKIPATIQIVDSGDTTVIEESELFLHIEFHGKYLKGRWVFKRGGQNEILWDMEKSRSPQVAKRMSLSDMNFIAENSSKMSRRQLAEKIGFAKKNVWQVQKRLGL